MEQEPSYRPSSEAFAAYFAEEISAEERQAIERWIADAEDHALELEQLRLVWQDLGTLRTQEVKVDLNAAFLQVKQKKNATSKTMGQSPVWKVAAAILLLVTVTWWFWKPSVEPVVFLSQGVQEINLSDGSLVTLNKDATLIYPEQFAENERGLQLQGEGFFSVEEEANRPFRIYAGPVTVTVLGTEFKVNATEEFVEVAVASGKVEVASDYVRESLTRGGSIRINLADETYQVGSHSNSGAAFYWVNQQLNFDGLELSLVFAELETIFNAEIEVSNTTINNCRLQAAFEGQNLAEIIEIIALSQNLEVSADGSNYLLTGEGCDN